MASADSWQASHTSLHGFLLLNSYPQHSCQTSPGKNTYFRSTYPLHLHRLLRIVSGFVLLRKLTRQASALYVVRVTRTRALPYDFLQIPPRGGHPCLKLTVGTINPRNGLSPTSKPPCRAHNK